MVNQKSLNFVPENVYTLHNLKGIICLQMCWQNTCLFYALGRGHNKRKFDI